MKILVIAGCSEGFVMPLVPLSWALRAAGHDVLVAASENMGPTVTGAGLPFAPTCPAVEMPEVLSFDRDGNRTTMPREEEPLLRHIGRGYGRLVLRMRENALALADRWKPDLVLTETYSLTGPMVAAERGIPWIEQGIRLASPELIRSAGVEELAPELDALGLTEFPAPLLSLDVCPPSMRPRQRPGTTKMRYVPYNGRTDQVPSWVFEERKRPRLCLTFGTRVPLPNKNTIPGGLTLLQALSHELPKLGFEVVVAVSDRLAATLDPLPEGVLAAGQFPLSAILPACDVVVHHGGHGTTLTCLAEGVPQVSVPVIAEVWDSARLVHAVGAGIQVPWTEASVETVTAACSTIRDDSSYARTARGLKDEMAALASPADVVRLIERG
ncbi:MULTISPECIES: nucleotide disphospho-sugar-binding domain-containing protein [unclassified Streptomyces]|uniref:nucleotide disphospho-sugar-binding domain-containing protein n=1 Tax=unclassified Streptomyces TaxID=2593676 RepID=UPI0033F9F9FD